MITDRQLTFSPDQALTNGTALSEDIVDTGVAGININTNRELQIIATVTTEFSGGTNLTANLIESDSADMSSPTVLASSGQVAVADLEEGKVLLRTGVPRTSKRYLGMQYVSSGTHSDGTVFAGIVLDTDDTAIPAYETGY